MQAIEYFKQHGSTVIITTHRPRLVGAVDKLLVLRAGQQVGFGPAQDMLNALRNLQVVNTPKQDNATPEPPAQDQAQAQGAVAT